MEDDSFVIGFNKSAELRNSKYRIGYTIGSRDPCVLVEGDSVVCSVDKYTSNTMLRMAQVAIALENTFPDGI